MFYLDIYLAKSNHFYTVNCLSVMFYTDSEWYFLNGEPKYRSYLLKKYSYCKIICVQYKTTIYENCEIFFNINNKDNYTNLFIK